MGDGNSFPFVVWLLLVILACKSIVLCKCSGKYIDIYFSLKITFFLVIRGKVEEFIIQTRMFSVEINIRIFKKRKKKKGGGENYYFIVKSLWCENSILTKIILPFQRQCTRKSSF